jgi:hypothetical protein
MFKDPAFARLPAILTSTVKAGWFEGSVCFAIFSTYTPLPSLFSPFALSFRSFPSIFMTFRVSAQFLQTRLPLFSNNKSFPPPTFSARYPILLTSHLGLLNYRWAHAGLSDSLDAGIASLISVLCFGAGGYYAKSGDNGGGVLLVVAGALQGWAGRSGL